MAGMLLGAVLVSLALLDGVMQRVEVDRSELLQGEASSTFTGGHVNPNSGGNSNRTSVVASELLSPPFRFHVYDVPERYGEGALRLLEERWPVSFCNRRLPKSNYTMLDWRHALSLFTADVWMVRHIRSHPAHTNNPAEADIFIIPIIPHVYHCAHVSHYMIEVVRHIQQQYPYIRVYDQHDHFMFWWRWALHHRSVQGFWRHVQRNIPNVKLISYDLLEIMGRNDYQDFSLALKPLFLANMLNVVVPYPDMAPALRQPPDMAAPRPVLFYFAGTHTIGGVRRWIRRNCQKEPQACVYETFASTGVTAERLRVPLAYPEQMRRAVFCGHAAGDALSSRRPTSAVLAGCIPVIMCDLCIMPFEGVVGYSRFAVFIPEDVVIAGRMMETLRSIPARQVRHMQKELRRVRSRFTYNADGLKPNDALDTLVQELALRGALLRQYKRWWQTNRNLSSSYNDYPSVPPARRRYMLPPDAPGAAEFNAV
ncbi:putative xyloglucan galactosyltransferase KATAMARI1-like [Trypanosoma grayi]|uniref:putative xyloglucan galactosyltransferase KATAMARI1-like n=1 Tax=Trypanosoma grayi TaxID=71804 RepID=UPI0004F41A39|nr:putative xyloglucan galactosyltransferase KATAMARI1-like [Trypanosoma grayi]KEG07511.1 putative xyloglucan galactosyltransferase KATAMARI1-like [Trypanosoma grayi]